MSANNSSLHNAAKARQDEFYTQLSDIENELKYYKNHFRNKVIYCNCDDPRESGFFHYFSYNFDYLGLKKLITTCYKSQNRDIFSNSDSEKAIYLEYNGLKDNNRVPSVDDIGIKYLDGDGDFQSPQCIELLKEADIVVTNPPFSLFSEYISQLLEYDKKFLIIGNQEKALTKDVISHIVNNKIWLGYNSGDMKFKVPDYYTPKKTRFWIDDSGQKWRSMGNICWYTNLEIDKRKEDLILYKSYSPDRYPKYDSYDAIEVKPYKDIPYDYSGKMGVPVSFLTAHNPNQFEILGADRYVDDNRNKGKRNTINGHETYARLIIKNKKL